jgi:hypothetical protein
LHLSPRYGVKSHGLCFPLLYRQNFTVGLKSDRTDQFLVHCTSSRRRQTDCPNPRIVSLSSELLTNTIYILKGWLHERFCVRFHVRFACKSQIRFGVSAIWCPTRINFYLLFAPNRECDLVCDSVSVLPLPLRTLNRTENRMIRENGSNSVSGRKSHLPSNRTENRTLNRSCNQPLTSAITQYHALHVRVQ